MATTRVLGYGVLLLCLASVFCVALGRGGRGVNIGAISEIAGPGETVYNVLDFGAKPNGQEQSTMQFIRAWNAACHSEGEKKRLVIPRGEFLIGPVIFQGPCNGTAPIVVQILGTVKASTDISEYPDKWWILFERINGLVIAGGGTINGQGETMWEHNNCKNNPSCELLPASVKFSQVSNAIIRGITSLNSMGFHYTLYACTNFRAKRLRIIAPETSPNTDGIHLSNCSNVKIAKSVIGTGDDCISIGQGCTNVLINKITCGPGHGISVGSLGKYKVESNVRGISVKNCTLSNTTNGLRIKTWPDSIPLQASSFLFQNIVMNSVKNPIIIDQEYCAKSSCEGRAPSRVRISDIHYYNIRGTSTSEVAVKIACSRAFPCQNIDLMNIDLKYAGPLANTLGTTSTCANANLKYSGLQNPPACSQ